MTWRERIAKYEQYADVGQYRIRALRDALVAGSAVKILFWPEMPVWVVVACSPLVLCGFFGVGWLHRHIGWMQESSNVPVTEGMAIPTVVLLEMVLALCRHAGVPLNGTPHRMSEELQRLLEAKR